LLSPFYAVKLDLQMPSGHSSVVERLVANHICQKTFFCKSIRFNSTYRLSRLSHM